jgi:signal transduction histidine kinase
VLAVTAQRSVDEVLQELVHRARELAGARHAALGTPDGDGGFSRFLVSGMSEAEVAALGPLPRTHGLLGAMLETAEPYRTDDIRRDPRFRGWWPRGHPDMRSFLGVPIVAPEGVIGAFYLTGKEDAPEFAPADQEVIELLAAHAAIAITNAELYERSRELSILAERNRLALELHDVVSQKLFSLVPTADAAGTLLDRDAAAAREQVERLQALAGDALEELRALVLELRPPDLERDGLDGALRKHVALLRRLHGADIALDADVAASTGDAARDREVLRVAQEALHNAVRHAAAAHIGVTLGGADGRVVLEVRDDGIGFDPAATRARARRLGLTSMEERATELGGTLRVTSTLGEGTTVRLEVPVP